MFKLTHHQLIRVWCWCPELDLWASPPKQRHCFLGLKIPHHPLPPSRKVQSCDPGHQGIRGGQRAARWRHWAREVTHMWVGECVRLWLTAPPLSSVLDGWWRCYDGGSREKQRMCAYVLQIEGEKENERMKRVICPDSYTAMRCWEKLCRSTEWVGFV